MLANCVWVVICVVFSTLFSLANANPVKLASWAEYSSEHFLLYSDRPARQATSLLKDFERFRSAVLAIVGLPNEPEDRPTQIYLFADRDDYALFQPDDSIAGFYRDTLQGARMVVGAEAKLQDVSLVLFHEYAHHLTRSRSGIRYPLWYDEGFADVLASAVIEKKHVLVGQANPWREKTVGHASIIPVAELLKAPEGKNDAYWQRFYASAWLFVHYLQLEFIHNNPAKEEKLRRFLLALHSGIKPSKAFKAYLGMSEKEMDKRLQEYARRRYWKGYQVSVAPYRGRMDTRQLQQNEIAYLLGDLAYRSGQPQSSLELLQYINGGDISAAPALSLRAVLEGHRSRFDLANHFIDLAVSMDEDHPVVATNVAHFYWDQLKAGGGKQEVVLNKVLNYASKALRVNNENIEAGRFLAHAYSHSGQNSKAITVLKNIHQRRPTDILLNFELGKLLAKTEDVAAAKPYLNNVLSWDHSLARKRLASQWLEASEENKTVLLSEANAHDEPAPSK